jgi:hypothetical protein
MGIFTFITEAALVRDTLRGLGKPLTPPTAAPARVSEQVQPAPEYEFDQRLAW